MKRFLTKLRNWFHPYWEMKEALERLEELTSELSLQLEDLSRSLGQFKKGRQ
jgi:exonuclease VII small subunit